MPAPTSEDAHLYLRLLEMDHAERPDDAWRTAFPGSKRRVVTAVTRPLRSRYRYTGSGS